MRRAASKRSSKTGSKIEQVGRTPGTTAVVILAGGSGSRVGNSQNKVYLPLAGRRMVSWSVVWAAEVTAVKHVILVVRAQDASLAEQTLRREAPPGLSTEIVVGGSTRHGSEQAALDHLAPRITSGHVEVIAIHDGARPLAGPALFRSVITTATDVGGAIPALPAVGVLPAAGVPSRGVTTTSGPDGKGTPARLARVQTPQAFRAPDVFQAYARAQAEGYQGTDTASSLERYSKVVVQVVPGSRHNLKVTYTQDLLLAERLLALNGYRMP